MKLIFVWFRNSGVTHEQALADWKSERHTSIVKKIPGLKKWIQNHPIERPNDTVADGIGELWFDNAQTMQQAMTSAEMAAAFEDGKRVADMERSYGLVVEENVVIE